MDGRVVDAEAAAEKKNKKQSLQCCTVAAIAGRGVRSHTRTHLEIIWRRHVRHQNKGFSQVLHLRDSFHLHNSASVSSAGCADFPPLSFYIFQINERLPLKTLRFTMISALEGRRTFICAEIRASPASRRPKNVTSNISSDRNGAIFWIRTTDPDNIWLSSLRFRRL